MSTASHHRATSADQGLHPELVDLDKSRVAPIAWAVTRIAIGFVFLWAFVDKLFGLGFATPSERAWANGGSPTTGFLSGVEGPLAGFFNGIAGQGWADWAFMLGLLGIGVALMAGIAMRIAAVSGAVMLVMMYLAVLPLENNPIIDDHIVYAVVLVGLAAAHAGRTFGFGRIWENLSLVERFPILK